MKKIYLSGEEIAEFFAELYVLRQSEVPEKEALQMMAEGQNKKAIQQFLNTLLLAPDLIQGLQQFPTIIPEYITALLTQAAKNNLEIQVLGDIAEHLSKLSLADNGVSYRQQLINYLFYPVIILLLALILAAVILIYVIPVFDDLYQGLGAELPALTRLFIELSNYAQPIIGLMLILVLILTVYLNTPFGTQFKSKLLLCLPIIGRAIASIESAAVINTLYLLCRYQFSLTEALRLSSTATHNTVVIAALIDSADKVSKGQLWIDSLKPTRIFLAKTLRLLAVFEKTQRLSVLQHLAQSDSKAIHSEITLSLRLLNIILLIGCWLFVGLMVIALYLPIFQIGAGVAAG